VFGTFSEKQPSVKRQAKHVFRYAPSTGGGGGVHMMASQRW